MRIRHNLELHAIVLLVRKRCQLDSRVWLMLGVMSATVVAIFALDAEHRMLSGDHCATGSQEESPDDYRASDLTPVKFGQLDSEKASGEGSGPQIDERRLFEIGSTVNDKKLSGVFLLQSSSDGRLLAARDRNNDVTLYRVDNGAAICQFSGHENNWIQSLQFSRDGKLLVTGAGSGESIKIWDTIQGNLSGQIDIDATHVCFANVSEELVALEEKSIRRYRWREMKLLSEQAWPEQRQQRLTMAPDGRMAVLLRQLNSKFYRIQLFDTNTQTLMQLEATVNKPERAAISFDCRWLAIAYEQENRIRLIDLLHPLDKTYLLSGHQDGVASLAFSPDNRWLVSGGEDAKVLVWDVLTRQQIVSFSGHDASVEAVVFRGNELEVASATAMKDNAKIMGWSFRRDVLRQPTADQQVDDSEQLWQQLGAGSLNNSFAALSELIARHKEIFPSWQQRLEPNLFPRTVDNLAGLLSQLQDAEYQVREQATRKLKTIYRESDLELLEGLATAVNPEVRYRLRQASRQSPPRAGTRLVDQRRWHRLILAWEMIGDEDSLAWLNKVAVGHVNEEIAAVAEQAVNRLSLQHADAGSDRDD